METTDYTCAAEDIVDAKLTARAETIAIIEQLTREFIHSITNDIDPQLSLVKQIMLAIFMNFFQFSADK